MHRRGALLALAIVAMTVGLIRNESAGDLHTLTATGATSGIRRTLTGVTAGALVLLGALLGVAGAYLALAATYLALAATYLDELAYLGRIPLLPVVLIVAAVPLAAAAAGLAGRRPRAARHRHDRLRRVGILRVLSGWRPMLTSSASPAYGGGRALVRARDGRRAVNTAVARTGSRRSAPRSRANPDS